MTTETVKVRRAWRGKQAEFSTPAQRLAACLSFDPDVSRPALEQWAALQGPTRDKLLNVADHSGLTLQLWRVAREAGIRPHPDIARACEQRLDSNRLRVSRLRTEQKEMLALFARHGWQAVVLKGFTLAPDFVPAAEYRVQYDLDFYLSASDAQEAFTLLREHGYEPLAPHDRIVSDHLPTLIPKTGWEWRGDYFDPDLPTAIELHAVLWNFGFERIALSLRSGLLERAVSHSGMPAMPLPDRLTFCTLHALRHLFRSGLRLSHLYEIAWFLDTHAEDDAFWREWTQSEEPRVRRLCCAGFLLAARVFDCSLSPALEDEFAAVPAGAVKWVERFGRGVADGARPDKSEVLLQRCFIETRRDRLAVVRRRLLPMTLPGPVDAVFVPEEQLSLSRRVLRSARQARFVAARARVHLASLPRFVAALWTWWRP